MHNLFTCQSCGKEYKNAKSLRTHRYTYHRQKEPELYRNKSTSVVKNSSIVSSPSHSEISVKSFESFDDQFEMEKRLLDAELEAIDMKGDIESLRLSLDELKTLVRKLEENMIAKTSTVTFPNDNEHLSHEVKRDINSNKNDILNLKDRITNIENKANYYDDDSEEQDLIDDMSEIRDLLSSHNYEKIIQDIPKLRKVLKYMLQNGNFDEANVEIINLLNSISHSSKSTAKEIIKDNFTHLTTIFENSMDNIDSLSYTEMQNDSGSEMNDDLPSKIEDSIDEEISVTSTGSETDDDDLPSDSEDASNKEMTFTFTESDED